LKIIKNPLFWSGTKNQVSSNALLDRIKATIGLIMSLGSILLVVFKWFKRPEDEEEVEVAKEPNPIEPATHHEVAATPVATGAATSSVTDRLNTAISSVETIDK